ncbi:GNAT family acetyltransferase [Acuticoccus sp. I52.16.1]|uniref:GNAT family acetyltransferase n=1 Tax=Acuticoccus sp. I52.16.1 TaxID=2928472 RepID=UPI001FD12AD5|nr:GNAT family acetyltransferase [Acuticoccus sp. I52.16.1]UOM33540.1 GNAT family acetyltransferase [Acuticoccus sp. I52.16.1]
MPLRIEPLAAADLDTGEAVAQIVALWDACRLTRLWNDPVADLRLAVEGAASAVLVGRVGERLVATVMVGHDGHRGAVYYVAVAPEAQRDGTGRAMMAAAEAWLKARGVPKLNLMVRRENRAVAGFYAALGYAEEDVVVLSKRLAS